MTTEMGKEAKVKARAAVKARLTPLKMLKDAMRLAPAEKLELVLVLVLAPALAVA